MAPMLNNTANKTGIHMPGRMVLSTIKISLLGSLQKKEKQVFYVEKSHGNNIFFE